MSDAFTIGARTASACGSVAGSAAVATVGFSFDGVETILAGVLATAAGLGVGAGEFFRELLVLDAVYGLMTGEFSLEFTGEFEAGRNWFSAPKRSEPVRKLPAHSEAARTRFHRCDIPPRRISNDRDIAVPPVVLISPASAAALDTGELFAAPLALALTIALHPC